MSETAMFQVIDPEGRADESAVAGISEELMMRAYRLMVFTRAWNTKALSLQRQGRLGTVASVRGQEGANAGMGLALKDGDWFLPAGREYGVLFARGVKARDQYLYWGGDERGARPPEGSRVLPANIAIGSLLPHAAGLAMAAKIKGEKTAVLSSSGDGSTSEGDFHEALNFAGVFKVPVVFAIQNNGWAISVPVEKQTATATLAGKACAYGIRGERVDGNDVLAVYLTISRLLDDARERHVPALCELVTYRIDDHTTSDDARRYRPDELVAPWRAKDPIDRMRKYLTAKRGWNEQKESALLSEVSAEIEQAVKEYEAFPPAAPTDIFNHHYAVMPWNQKEQAAGMAAHSGGKEKE